MLLKIFREIKSRYLKESPRGKWSYIRDLNLFVSKLVGIEVLDPLFELYWYSYLGWCLCIDYTICSMYTFWHFWFYTDTPIKGLLFIPVALGVVIPSLTMYIVVMTKTTRDKLRSLVLFGGEQIYTDIKSDSDPVYIRACDESAIKLLRTLVATLSLILLANFCYGCFPLYAFVINNEIQLALPVLLPFTDIESTFGLILNLLNQLFISVLGILGNYAIEIGTSMVKNSMWGSNVAISYAIDKMSNSIIKNRSKPLKYVDYEFRNILIQLQDFDRFLLDVIDVIYWKLTLQPYLLVYSISICLFFYVTGVWVSGLGVAIFCYVQLYVLCDMGDEVTKVNEMLTLKLHEMPWYFMSRRSQLDYAHALNRLQNGAVLRIGPFAVLNYETFGNLTKGIYSFLATIISFLEQ